MKRVIGGEFAIEQELLNKNKSMFDIDFSTGRAALYGILVEISRRFGKLGQCSILIPDYLCDSITNTIIDVGWNYKFYHIDENFEIKIDKIKLDEADVILVINYFGLLHLDHTISELRSKKDSLIVIEDDVQAFYDYQNSNADYSFTSLRKWFPCPDGALIKSTDKVKPVIKNDSLFSQYKSAGNLLKMYSDVVDDSICLELLERGETLLDKEYLSECSDVSKVIFSNIDLKKVSDIRKQNAKILHDGLESMRIKHLYREDKTPLFIPIFLDNRNALRKELFNNEVFVPIHWPVSREDVNKNSDIYSKELSLICDQRYDEEDIKKQLSIIRQFIDRR